MRNLYDMILVGIPTSFIGAGGFGTILGIDPITAAPAGAVGAMALMAYGLFVDPPRSPALGPHQ